MARSNNIKKLLKYLSPDKTSADFIEFDKQVSALKDQLKEKITIKTLDDVSTELSKFKKKLNLQPLLDSLEKLKLSFDTRSQTLFDEIEIRTRELSNADKARVQDLNTNIRDLQLELSTLEEARKNDLEIIYTKIPNLNELEDVVNEMMLEISSRLDSLEEVEVEDWQKKIDQLRSDLMSRISQLGGGAQNRQMFIGGVDPLTRYTDVNFKAGSNVTLTYANNNTTQKVDITISATGGSGSGIIRSVNSVAVNTDTGSAPTTDYVYLVSGTTTITLPTSVGNSNLYTVKNIGAGTVTIVTTGGETIDGGVNVVMPVQFTSVDLISNNSGNWDVT